MSANPRVMKPQKYDPANVTRNEVKLMPKINPTYFARSPRSIFMATRSILGFPPVDGLGLAIPDCDITAGVGPMLWTRCRSANRSRFDEHVHQLANIERE